MNFNLSDEQNMVKDSLARFVADNYDQVARNSAVANEQGFSPDNWQTFAELGWLSMAFDEDMGGFGGTATDVMVVMEELGKGLVAEPYLATVLLFGGLLAESGKGDLQQELIGRLIEGQLQGAFAYLERQSRFEITDICTTAQESSDGFTLNGEKTVVFNGAVADKFIVTARTAGDQCDEEGISLFLVDADAAGISKTAYRLMDGQLVCNIRLDNVQVGKAALLGEQHKGYDVMQPVIQRAMIALSAEALGIMEKLTATTVEYSKTRKQFGVAIGSFQVLQHRMVDMFIAAEQTKSLLYRAVCSSDAESSEAEKDVIALKVMTGRSGKLVGGEAIQLHGGMGMADELDVGHYVKRLMMINTTFGDADYNERRFSALG
ncbi:Flavoprotein desaturase PigA [Zhongshania aliphaticivorans]|uniref:Flavoprotein desaturase PigA n=1 Tax=Zhongshania aliphaticivorans TaxID=1470434 RepID=A0A5S9MYR5_9GAMM|nr:acyl-CoA dehydrogenase family protein [Zhongshania aliphaticivorans]CAA0081850.1 Flavoprotein desaturase PigA [Zhongshania aliphaticivorans]CAA0084623.1 Flavoprotein desaturase PigA [Zhongshania aliphaticivorans]